MRRFSAALLLLLCAPAHAAINRTLHHQGFLTDKAAGEPVDAAKDMRLRLFDGPVSGSALFTETLCGDGSGADGPAVGVSRGRYEVEVGSHSGGVPASVFLDRTEVWLETGVDPDGGCDSFEPLLPRVRLRASAYAFEVLHASTASAADPVFTADTVAALDTTANGALTVSTNVYVSGRLGIGAQTSSAVYITGGLKGGGGLEALSNLEIVQPQTDPRLVYSPAVFDCGTGNWCDSPGWGANRLGSNARYTECYGNKDCSSNYVELKLDDNEYRTVLFSHLDWEDSYALNVYVSFDGGTNYALFKSVDTRRLEMDSTPYTSTIRAAVSHLPLGSDVRVRLAAGRGRVRFEGFGLSRIDLPDMDEKAFSSFTRLTGKNNDSTCNTNGGCGPSALSVRQFQFVKTQANTQVRISYTDNMRCYGVGASRCCQYHLYFDGAACPTGDIQGWNYANYGAANQYDPHRMRSIVGYCGGLAAGEYTIQVYVSNCPGYGARCWTGWDTSTFALEAEEVQ